MDNSMIPYYPNTIKIELVQGCNLSCSFCGINGIESEHHFMTFTTYKKIIDLCKVTKRKFRFSFSLHGEPSLSPIFSDCLKYLKKEIPHSYVQCFTNGITYFETKQYKLEDIIPYVDDFVLDDYKLQWSVESLKEFFKNNVDTSKFDVYIELMQDGVPFYKPKNVKAHRVLLCPNIALQTKQGVKQRQLNTHCGTGGDPSKVAINRDKRCHIPFRQLAFRWDGKVALCCNDYRGYYYICDTTSPEVKTFADVWLHPRFESARKIIYHQGRHLHPCNKCNDKGNRLGLLPDPMGMMEMPKPTYQDYTTWKEATSHGTLTEIRLRKWEEPECVKL